jgi:hypothetical protein
MIVSLAVDAGAAVARFSEVSRYTEVRSSDTVKRRAHDVGVLVQRLAASVLLEQDGHLDRDEILAAADGLLDEIDDEDDGLMHAGSAIASLLRARWLCAEDEIKLAQAELETADAPLLAQYACTAHTRLRRRAAGLKTLAPPRRRDPAAADERAFLAVQDQVPHFGKPLASLTRHGSQSTSPWNSVASGPLSSYTNTSCSPNAFSK